MKKGKIAFWLIIAALIGFVVWQNVWFFETRNVEIRFFGNPVYTTPGFPVVLLLLVAFLAGLLISYASGLSEKFIAKKTIRALNSELGAASKNIDELEQKLHSLQIRPAHPEPVTPVPQADTGHATEPVVHQAAGE